jgi:hypothetical protein
MKIRRCVDSKDPRSVFSAKTSCVITLPWRVGNQQAVETLNGQINSNHQDTKAPRKTDSFQVSICIPWCLGALVVNTAVFPSVLSAFSGNFNYPLDWRLRSESYSPYSVANDRHVEINKKPETFAAELQIGQKLSLEQWSS